jgi:hypothetical protein
VIFVLDIGLVIALKTDWLLWAVVMAVKKDRTSWKRKGSEAAGRWIIGIFVLDIRLVTPL